MTDVRIDPAVVQEAASTFATGQWTVSSGWDVLASTLAGCDGMAGHAPDKAALAFAPRYNQAVAAAWRGFGAAVRSVGGISLCLGKTAGNYLKADRHSTITTPAGSGLVLAPTQQSVPFWQVGRQVVTDKTMPAPPSVLGGASTWLPKQLADLWPTGDSGKLRNAAAAWRDAGDHVSTAAGKLGTAIHSVTGGNTTGDARAIDDVWSRLYAPCNERTVLYTLPRLCHNVADACGKYADAIDHARSKAEWELAGVGLLGAVVLGVGGALTPETGGASDAGAITVDAALARATLVPIAGALLATVGGLGAGALAEHIVQATEDSASNAPHVQPTDAETQSLQGALEKEVGAGGGEQEGGWDNGKPPADALEKVPDEWGDGKPNKKGVGYRWTDPQNPGNGIRIDEGDPSNPQPAQRVDHVVVRVGGKVIGRDGQPLEGSIKQNWEQAHIPLSEWLKWGSWRSP
ncbi:WXG100-like domain-containing protein [Actinomadura napierensis]|uniref:Outer membrane channel protein CpnT-like N-terminal domain-containing protein n=1 Tax=Actinomadura napierensis TaxID=267854 RepID=A0ABN2YH96_9ACTN